MKAIISRKDLHILVYKFCLLALVCFLPLSKYLLSITQFLLAFNWLMEGEFKKKMQLLKRKSGVILFASLFLVYIIGAFYSENHALTFTKIKNVLPVLLLPLAIGTSAELSKKFVRYLLLLFACAVACAAISNLVFYSRQQNLGADDLRQMTLFMSQIRFSLLVNMAIFIFIHHLTPSVYRAARYEIILCLLLALILIAYLFLWGSFSGIVIFIVLSVFSFVAFTLKVRQPIVKAIVLLSAFACILALLISIIKIYNRNFNAKPINIETLDMITANGNLYYHSDEPWALENGNFINIYICEKELGTEWNRISIISYDSIDRKGQNLSFTLKRYLTSKGLRKDSLGIQKLTSEDIAAIENGITNYRFNESSYLFQRLYGTLWELHIYNKTGYVQNHSFAQRLEFYKIALGIAKKHIILGVGTGDVQDAMLEEAKQKNKLFEEKWEGKPHNQFIFFILAFGITGFTWIIFSWIYPIINQKKYRIYLLNVFLIISFSSMLVIDTLESYNSIVFFLFFYCLFVFADITEDETILPGPKLIL